MTKVGNRIQIVDTKKWGFIYENQLFTALFFWNVGTLVIWKKSFLCQWWVKLIAVKDHIKKTKRKLKSCVSLKKNPRSIWIKPFERDFHRVQTLVIKNYDFDGKFESIFGRFRPFNTPIWGAASFLDATILLSSISISLSTHYSRQTTSRSAPCSWPTLSTEPCSNQTGLQDAKRVFHVDTYRCLDLLDAFDGLLIPLSLIALRWLGFMATW